MLNAAQDLPEEPALLKAMTADLQAENAKLTATVRAHDLVVQAVRLRIAKLKKQAFGSPRKRSRSDERREGKGCVSPCRSRGWVDLEKKKKIKKNIKETNRK